MLKYLNLKPKVPPKNTFWTKINDQSIHNLQLLEEEKKTTSVCTFQTEVLRQQNWTAVGKKATQSSVRCFPACYCLGLPVRSSFFLGTNCSCSLSLSLLGRVVFLPERDEGMIKFIFWFVSFFFFVYFELTMFSQEIASFFLASVIQMDALLPEGGCDCV